MGDRANVKIVYEDGQSIYLYTHWGGEELPQKLQNALTFANRKGRLDNSPYLARMIFCNMLHPDEMMTDIGYSIAPYMCENEHDILEVNVPQQKVRQLKFYWKKNDIGYIFREWTFKEFIELDIDKAFKDY